MVLKTGVLSRTVFGVWGGFLGLGEVRDLYRKVGDIGGLHFHQVPSKSVPRGAKTSQKTVYLRIPSEQTTCCFLQARTEPSNPPPRRAKTSQKNYSNRFGVLGVGEGFMCQKIQSSDCQENHW